MALITSNNGSIAHQAEHIANKVGIAVLMLASDPDNDKDKHSVDIQHVLSDTEQARLLPLRFIAPEGFTKSC